MSQEPQKNKKKQVTDNILSYIDRLLPTKSAFEKHHTYTSNSFYLQLMKDKKDSEEKRGDLNSTNRYNKNVNLAKLIPGEPMSHLKL